MSKSCANRRAAHQRRPEISARRGQEGDPGESPLQVIPSFVMNLSVNRLSFSWGRECPVVSGPGAVERLPDYWPESASGAVLICDANAFRLHGDRVLREVRRLTSDVLTLPFEPGEDSKSATTVQRLQAAMFQSRVDRNGIVIAFGGGVAMDLAGFVASTYMRGLSLVNVATTLVAAVDAGIGGKTGINTPSGKNLIGSFHWPEAVLVDDGFLTTLPPAEVRCGLSETVKSGVVAAPDILDALEASAETLAGGSIPEPAIIEQAVRMKVNVVSRDPFEKGERRVLNFGHTAGHGIEAATAFGFGHGNAVACGMAIEGRVARNMTEFSEPDLARLVSLLDRLGLDTRPPCRFSEALPAMQCDKKNRGGHLRMALPRASGEMANPGGRWVVETPLDVVEACWNG